MTRRQNRLALIGAAMTALGLSVGLAFYALSDSLVFFVAPSDIAAKGLKPGARVRIGGLVEAGSVKHGDGEKLEFDVTDGKAKVHVAFTGLPPDLFREGQGVLAEGVLTSATLVDADTILAKHDEKYMPKEVVEALKKQGRWKEGAQ